MTHRQTRTTCRPHKKSPRRHRRSTHVLMLGAAAASSIAGAEPARAAQAPAAQQAASNRADVPFALDVPAGSLEAAAAAFESVTGIRVTLANPDLGSLPSPGVRGMMTARAAMTQLIAGTSVQATFRDDAVELAVAGVSENVQVVGAAAAPPVSSPRYTVPTRDIAQTVALVPRAIIEQRVATTLTDVLRNVPGITLQAGEGGGSSNTAGDMFNMRGFSANNSLFVDNVRDSGLISRDVFNVEQVEVFMGPTGSDVGRGTAAGYVNMATKRPHAGTSMAVMASGGTADQGRVTADLNWSAPAVPGSNWWSHAAVRLNALWQDRGVPGRDFVQNESQAVAPAVVIGLDTDTRVFGSAQIMRQDNVPDYGIPTAAWAEQPLAPTVVQTLRPVRQANFFGSPDVDYDRAEQNAVLARVEHDVRRNLTVSNQTRYNRTHRDAVVSAITNVAAYVPATNLVTIARQGNERENTIVSNQTTLVNRFATGSLRHGFSGGVELLRENQFAPGKQGMGTRAPVNIFSPNSSDPVADYAPSRSLAETKGTTNSLAAYANDSVEMGQRWLVSGGFRLERYQTDYRAVGATGVTTTDLSSEGILFSGRGSVLFRMNDTANVYLSYGTTVTPPGEGNFQLSAAANNVNNPNLDPQRSANLEAGTKVDLARGRLALIGAVFRTRNKNIIYTVDANAVPPIFNQDDDQLVKGVTIGALGQVTDRWRIITNAAYLAASLESQGPNNGTRLTLTPAFSASLWTTLRVVGALSVGGGVQHVGSSFVNAANTVRIPDYTLVDGLVEYELNRHLTLRLNVYNVTDEVYVKNVNNNGGRYNPGNPRSALFTTNVAF
jgi:catecholate siderophore receptor